MLSFLQYHLPEEFMKEKKIKISSFAVYFKTKPIIYGKKNHLYATL